MLVRNIYYTVIILLISPLKTNTPYTYTLTAPPDPFITTHRILVADDNSHIYFSSQIGDFATITITNLHDGKADGTFSAKLRRISDQAITDINGTFKNVSLN